MSEEEILATDGAVELAEEANLDLSEVEGSGDDGKIYKKDVENYLSSAIETVQEEEVGPSRAVKTIVRTLSKSGEYNQGAEPASQVDMYVASFLEEGFELVNTHYIGEFDEGYGMIYVLAR